jgi:DNA-binding response OmpR family regulator
MSTQKRVLVIEDEIELVDALERELRHSGCEVFTARDGVTGLEIALQYEPDLILLDLLLPRLKGMPMLERLREYRWGKAARVVVLTNFEDPSLIKEANKLGVKEYLVKSNYALTDIVAIIKRHLHQIGEE